MSLEPRPHVEGDETEVANSGVAWQSLQWADGAVYEGLSRNSRCHSHGVFQHANGDRYEGEFAGNRMSGYGAYVWADGTIYRGEWRESLMHGCGVALRRDGAGAWQAQEGRFFDDEFVGPVMSCSPTAALAAATEADVAASMARTFQTTEGRSRCAAARRGGGGSGGAGGGGGAGTHHSQPARPLATGLQTHPAMSHRPPLSSSLVATHPMTVRAPPTDAQRWRLPQWPDFNPLLAWPFSLAEAGRRGSSTGSSGASASSSLPRPVGQQQGTRLGGSFQAPASGAGGKNGAGPGGGDSAGGAAGGGAYSRTRPLTEREQTLMAGVLRKLAFGPGGQAGGQQVPAAAAAAAGTQGARGPGSGTTVGR